MKARVGYCDRCRRRECTRWKFASDIVIVVVVEGVQCMVGVFGMTLVIFVVSDIGVRCQHREIEKHGGNNCNRHW